MFLCYKSEQAVEQIIELPVILGHDVHMNSQYHSNAMGKHNRRLWHLHCSLPLAKFYRYSHFWKCVS